MGEYWNLVNILKVELDLSKYPRKADLKDGTGVDTSKFAKMIYLDKVDKLDINKLKKCINWLKQFKNWSR